MVRASKQKWEVGQTVKAGFVADLVVKAAIPTPGDCQPDAYLLTNKKGTQLYRFVPHHGLEKISLLEAREILAAAAWHARQVADEAMKKAQRDYAAVAAINTLIFADA